MVFDWVVETDYLEVAEMVVWKAGLKEIMLVWTKVGYSVVERATMLV